MTDRPRLIVVADGGINRDLPDLSAAFLSAAWDVPVIDLNGDPRPPGVVLDEGGGGDIALSVRAPAVSNAREIRRAYLERFPGARCGHALSPVDVQCCYPFQPGPDGDYSLDGEFGDDLGLPDFSRFDTYRGYRNRWRHIETSYPLLTSVGCPFGCRFCAAALRPWQARSVEALVEELDRLRADLDLHSFRIIDDCFNVKKPRVMEFCAALEGKGWRWMCANGLRADRFDEQMARAMAGAGCSHVSFGVESLDPDVLAVTRKNETAGQITRALKVASRNFPSVAGFVVVGLPGSTLRKDITTIVRGLATGADLHVSYYVTPEGRDAEARFWGEGARPSSASYAPSLQSLAYRVGWASSGLSRAVRRLTTRKP